MSALPVPSINAARVHTIRRGREVLRLESDAIEVLAKSLDESFARAVEVMQSCRGSVVVTGIGKAGLIGQKISASFSSTGTPSHFLHPAEAVHGDLGKVRSDDVVLLLSYSGETDEIIRLLPSLRELASYTMAITSKQTSTLAKNVDLTLTLGSLTEACPLGLAPSTTTTAMLALGDALALVASELQGFTRNHFARYHPAGALGRSLTRVEQIMRPLAECRVAHESHDVRNVLVQLSRPGRRTGAIMLHDDEGRLTGVFTDSDLAKLLERSGESQLDQPISSCMTRRFQVVRQGEPLPVALSILADRKISELPVVDEDQRPLGLIDVTDVMSVVKSYWPKPHTTAGVHDSSESVVEEPHILPLRRPKNT
ncbi:MAG: KpsF/GutQ family sugar-phosphate isomerase [Pirellulaceae bacterium]|nr:KpsF/GutQ family sugar-phosphate isomerase [Pirellulaceae bacterium]